MPKWTQPWEPKDTQDGELCKWYCLGLHKKMNSSRHYVHYLVSKFNNILLRKVQSLKLHLLI
jgi:hypothetical protein